MLSRQPRQTDEEPRRRGRAGWIVAVMVVVFVLYPLSTGPAMWLIHHGYVRNTPDGPAGIFYLPIKWLARMSPQFASVLSWYFDLWE